MDDAPLDIGLGIDRGNGIVEEAVALCYEFASSFESRFGSLRCSELRPVGFSSDNPPHLCEELTCSAIAFSAEFIADRFV